MTTKKSALKSSYTADLYISFSWGRDEENRRNQDRLSVIVHGLREKGFVVHFGKSTTAVLSLILPQPTCCLTYPNLTNLYAQMILPKIVTYPNFLIVDVLVTTRLTVLVFLSDFGILF